MGEFQEYPKMMYMPNGDYCIVQDATEEAAKSLDGWAERCAKLHGGGEPIEPVKKPRKPRKPRTAGAPPEPGEVSVADEIDDDGPGEDDEPAGEVYNTEGDE